MEKPNHDILVTYDFTDVAMDAVAHAVLFSKVLETGITLLHIVKKEDEVSEMEEQLQNEAKKVNEIYNVMPSIVVRDRKSTRLNSSH